MILYFINNKPASYKEFRQCLEEIHNNGIEYTHTIETRFNTRYERITK